jgi:hypothetical protein
MKQVTIEVEKLYMKGRVKLRGKRKRVQNDRCSNSVSFKAVLRILCGQQLYRYIALSPVHTAVSVVWHLEF